MDVIIKNKTLIKGLTKKQIQAVKDYLTISNPEFYKKVEMKLYHFDTPQDLKYYDTPAKDSVLVPVGATNDVLNLLVQNFNTIKEDISIDDQRFENDEHKEFFEELEFNGELRDYQQITHDVCMDKTVGVVEAMTGSGKTVIFTSFIVSRKQPTLILVNTKELAQQTIEAICKFTNLNPEDIGFVGSGEFDMKPITVGIHQTLARFDQEDFDRLNEMFGMIIADEVHIVAAETFFNNMGQLDAMYKFGFSATPRREDGLTDVIHFAAGPKIHKVPEEDLVDYVTIPSYRQVETGYYFFLADTQEYQLMLTDMAENEDRNEVILKEVRKHIESSCCLLCRRTWQVEYLAEMLGDRAVALTSKVSKKNRQKIMDQIRNKEKNIMVSTFGLMSTGIDIPHFEKMFYCGPVKSETKIRQSAGRLMRQADGKQSAEIIDFVDKDIHLLRHQAKHRKKIVTKLIDELSTNKE